jgi:hypothetical protein
MNYREEITKLIRASYDQGAKDAQQEALAALEQMVAAARADEREACEHAATVAISLCDDPVAAIRARGAKHD